MKKWECSVCGYIHEGDEPPDICPVCGAAKNMFEEVIEQTASQPEPQDKKEEKAEIKPPQSEYARIYKMITELMSRHHAHPISVHVPNGVVPLSVVFIILAILTGNEHFEVAAQYNIAFVLLTMPMVLFSGYADWQNRYKGAMTNLFLTKIVCGGIVTLCSAIMAIWWLVDPYILEDSSSHGGLFVAVSLLMLAAAGIAGFMGGKLVFKD